MDVNLACIRFGFVLTFIMSKFRSGPISLAKDDVFWAQVYKHPTSGCWLWTGVVANGKPIANLIPGRPLAYRATWEDLHGLILGARKLRRICDEDLCVNPTHYTPYSKFLVIGEPEELDE